MIKLIVSDFDGTLLPFGESEVSHTVKNRISTVLDRGITFAVSSGRTYRELSAFLPEFADSIYFICCDGAYYVKNGKTLYARKIEPPDLALFFGAAREGFSFVLHGAENNYSFGDIPSEAEIFTPTKISRVGEIQEKIFKVTAYGREFKPSPYSGLRMHWDGGKNSSAQYVNRFANKGTALSDLQTRLALTKFDTACMGDSGNDIVMMKGAKYSFAVGNRCDELVSAASFRADTAEAVFDSLLANI